MAESSDEKRRRLFDLYCRNRALYEPDKQGDFACPVCLRDFTREALDGPSPAVNLAHIVPDCLGGRVCTLTCTQCNSRGGSELEDALKKRFLAEDAAAGVRRAEARLRFQSGDVGVELEVVRKPGGLSVYCVPERSNPATIAALQGYLAEQQKCQGEATFSLTINYRHQPGPVAAALYQAAYLAMFSFFGYEFVRHPHFDAMRQQVLHPEQDIWRGPMAVLSEESAPRVLGTHRHAVLFVSEPPAIQVVLRLRPKVKEGEARERVLVVMLPGLDRPDMPSREQMTFRGSLVLFEENNLTRKGYMAEMWRMAQLDSSPHAEPNE